MAATAPTNQRTALAWARRQLTRQLRPYAAAAPRNINGRYRVSFCRHERDARNIARGYLSDDIFDNFGEIELDGNWPRIAAQLVSLANNYFLQAREGSTELFTFYTCDTCDHTR
ncbi:hypothetical protein [Glycomyces sp. NPDC021274]|uniref:hypothetical protein n=1 Tax=Glycomyces sp. NPDC021274 TaxID=3155120 RepID=UPI0033FD2D95